MRLANLGNRYPHSVAEITIITPPLRYPAVVKGSERIRSPGRSVDAVGDRFDVVVGKHGSRHLPMAHRNTIDKTGEPQRQFGHVQFAVHDPHLSKRRGDRFTYHLTNEVGTKTIM